MSETFLTIRDYLMGRDQEHPISPAQEKNAITLLFRVNRILNKLKINTIVTSGYRPAAYNVSIGGSKKSAHVECMAIDLLDKDGSIGALLQKNEDLLKECDLYLEHPDYTIKTDKDGKVTRWVHLQTRPTKRRIFIP